MNAEILCVGTELLLGDIINTNASYISKELAKIGINVYYHSVVGDNEERLQSQLKISLNRSDILIITGGLGATYDDMTKETVAKVLSKDLLVNDEVKEKIKEYFKSKNKVMTENNLKQALVPQGATVINNPIGTAPGLLIENGNPLKIIFLLPGVPRELKVMTDNSVIPYLSQYSEKTIVSTEVRLFAVEAEVENKLHSLMIKSNNPTIAPYAKGGEVLLRITSVGTDKSKAKELNEKMADKIREIYKDEIYGVDVPNIETALVNMLKEKGKKIACAESCTGGLFAKRITDISGASEIFECGICSYSDKIKHEVLGVSSESLKKYTAVSEQVALEMAQGVKKLSGADIAVSITGVAGPGDLSEELKQGLIFIGISYGDKTKTVKLNLGNGNASERGHIRDLAAKNAMFECLKLLLG